MTPSEHYRMFGNYNAWANQRLYDAAARLTTRIPPRLLAGGV